MIGFGAWLARPVSGRAQRFSNASAVVSCVVLALGCAELPQIEPEMCGNAVIEMGEDCDSFNTEPHAICRAPGSTGECHWDCRPQDDGTRPLCPADWGCDRDGLCQPPSGEFERPVEFALTRVSSLLAADFDGDGRSDLVTREPLNLFAQSALHFHYFDESLQLTASRDFPNLVLSPWVGDIDGDGKADTAFSDSGIGLMLGRADRNWLPETFSSYHVAGSRIRIVTVTDEAVDETGFLALGSFDEGTGFYVPDPVSGKLRLIGATSDPVESLVGDPVSGDLIEDAAQSPCREVVFAAREATSFTFGNACERARDANVIHWRSPMQLTEVALEPPRPINGAPLILDLNVDGHQDVLLSAGGSAYVAYGDGKSLRPAIPYRIGLQGTSGETCARTADVCDPAATDADAPPDFFAEFGLPLAAGDVTGDGIVDLVFPHFVLTSEPNPMGQGILYQTRIVNTNAAWTSARIADLNGNGDLDIVAASNGALNLDFFNGQSSPYLIQSTVATDAPVEHLAIGDFDGNTILDVVLVEATSQREPGQQLSIAFGSAASTPTRIPVGKVRDVEQLAAYTEQAISSFSVTSSSGKGAKLRGDLTLFQGTPTRAPIAPISLTHFATNGSVLPSLGLSLTMGHFQSNSDSQLLVLATDDANLNTRDWNYWLLSGLTRATVAPILLKGVLQSGLLPSHSEGVEFGVNISGLSADFDGDGRDEVLLAMPTRDEHCGLVLDGVGEDGTVEHHFAEPLQLPEPCPRAQLLAIDADGDGARDIAVLTGNVDQGAGQLRLLWNEGGTFDAQRQTQINAKSEHPKAFTWLQSSRDLGRIAWLSDDELVLLPSAAHRQFGKARRLGTLKSGTDVVAGDFDGDGVSDLAVAAAGQLSVYRARLRSQ